MSKSLRVAAIIVAAGSGIRMKTAEKKQFMMLADRPMLAYSICAFLECKVVKEIFLVVPEGDHGLCRHDILEPLDLLKPVHVVTGGASRQESVFNGLEATGGRFDLVAIHDGVRPLVRVKLITECIETAERFGGCIPAVPVSDTVKTVDEEGRVIVTMKRKLLKLAQTPQVFHYKLIYGAHKAAEKENFIGTDDAELVEKCGEVVKVIPGARSNIKITTLDDLLIAEVILKKTSQRPPKKP